MGVSLTTYHKKEYELETEVRRIRERFEKMRAENKLVDQDTMMLTAFKWLIEMYINEPFKIHKILEAMEYSLVERSFDLNKNVVKTAKFMGMNRSTLSMKLIKKGLSHLAEGQRTKRRERK